MFFIIMFLRQAMVLLVLLSSVSVALKKRRSKVRIFTGIIFGSLAGCIDLMFPWNPILHVLIFVMSVFITAWIGFGEGIRRTIYTAFCLFFSGILYGGIWFVLYNLKLMRNWFLGFLFVLPGMLLFYKYIWQGFSSRKDYLYDVTFHIGERKICVRGFLDTGNFLYEPIGKMPVSVIECSVLQQYIHQPLSKWLIEDSKIKIRMIPYHSVGKAYGMMTGILVTDMKITGKAGTEEIGQGMIAISEESLSGNGAYDLLIHPDLIKYGRS